MKKRVQITNHNRCKKAFISLGGLIAFSGLFLLFSGFHYTPVVNQGGTDGKWVAPPEADKLQNPLAGDATATAAGKKIFMSACYVCHGNKGKGDGPAGVALNPRPANFTLPGIVSETDGALFWKITNGRTPMASYKDIYTDTQRWQLVDYIRELQKNAKGTAKK